MGEGTGQRALLRRLFHRSYPIGMMRGGGPQSPKRSCRFKGGNSMTGQSGSTW
jgi:hypothetical protein